MTWDSVPWFVGGGAQHSPEVARLLAYAATSGAKGIVTPGDLKVVPLDVPGSSVRVLAGACLIPSEAAGGAQQTYVGRNPSADTVSISATGSGSGRSDLIVARVEDPFMPGEPWPDPPDVTVGPYIFTRVIPNVSPTTVDVPAGTTGLALARIDIPANTGTITAGMIKDLRKLALPRSANVYNVQQGTDPVDYVTTSEIDWHHWPRNVLQLDIPDWATHATINITLVNIPVDGPCDVNTRIRLGDLAGPISYFDYNGNPGTQAGFVETRNHHTFAEFDVTAIQGTRQTLRLDARRTYYNENQGNVWFGAWEQIVFDVRFHERAV